jgi:hypothetical protein
MSFACLDQTCFEVSFRCANVKLIEKQSQTGGAELIAAADDVDAELKTWRSLKAALSVSV